MRLLVKNGTVITPEGEQDFDILCEDGLIIGLLERNHQEEADEIVDASGKIIFPGFIDPHVHSRDPGLTHKEDFSHSTLGALVSGVTTILEMPNAIPPVDSVAVFNERKEQHAKNAWVNFGLWGIAIGESNMKDIPELFEAGVAAVKVFWGYALHKDTKELVYNSSDYPADQLIPPADNGTMLRMFEQVAKSGGVIGVHCEDKDVLLAGERSLGHPIESYEDFLQSRPAAAESISITAASEMAKITGARFHVVHMASKEGVDAVRAAQARGIKITAETCPQFLTLLDEDFDRIGATMKWYPPIRKRADQEALWGAILDGTISSIGSDHAPHTIEEKQRGFTTQPAGGVGTETFGAGLSAAFLERKVDLRTLADVVSTKTAKLYGLYPRKGAIQVGSDADLTIVDPQAEVTIKNEELVAKTKISAWNGMTFKGIPSESIIGGKLAMQNRQPVGERKGQFVRAQHSKG
ncbi:MAG: dihydroorotase family protein [Microbacteriaceae bacterium]